MSDVNDDIKMQKVLYLIDDYCKGESKHKNLLLPFLNLTLEQRQLAIFGIKRHFRYCKKNSIKFDLSVIREVINDAKQNKSFAKEMQDDTEKKLDEQVLRRRNVFVHSLSFTKKHLSRKTD